LAEQPTMETNAFGDKRWRLPNGKLHREDGPAVEFSDGYKEWWINGLRHRADGPAIEHPNGAKEWWYNGCLHREDGPASEYADGSKQWWIEGKLIYTEYPND